MNHSRTSGPWNQEERKMHVNELELLDAFNALRSFAQFSSNISIHLMLDNATSVAYINKYCGTHLITLNTLALELIQWWEKRNVSIQTFHIPGKENYLADY